MQAVSCFDFDTIDLRIFIAFIDFTVEFHWKINELFKKTF